MHRLILLLLSISISVWWYCYSFLIEDVSLNHEQARDLGLAAFVIEKTIDEHDFSRDDVVQIIKIYGERRW